MVMWVCEAWQVNIWTVFAVRPNGPNNKKKNNFASSRSDHLGSDKHKIQKEGKRCQKMFQLGFWIGDQLGRDVYLENRHMVTDVEVVHRNMFLNIGIDAHAGTIRGQTQLHPRNRCVTDSPTYLTISRLLQSELQKAN